MPLYGGAMRIILTSETSIRLVPEPGPMTIEARSVEQQYSPFHMLGSSLAFCTFSVMYSWATHVKLSVDDLSIDVSWEFAEDPHRVGRMDMTFDWPSLPAKRVNAAKRAAELCTVHATLHHPPTVTVRSSTEVGTDAGVAASTPSNQVDQMPDSREHAHEHTHADGTRHSHPHTHDAEHAHGHDREAAPAERGAAVRRGTDEGEGPADLPPSPTQQGDGQEAGTARPADRQSASEAR